MSQERTHEEQLDVCRQRFESGEKKFDRLEQKIDELIEVSTALRVDIAGHKGRLSAMAGVISLIVGGIVAFIVSTVREGLKGS